MSRIKDRPNAKSLFAFYDRTRADGDSISDVKMLQAIRKAYWVTNAASAVPQIFSIIWPACILRLHLTETLIRAPIEAPISCGEEDAGLAFRAGSLLLSQDVPSVSPDSYGQRWLADVLPTLQPMVDQIYPDVLRECLDWIFVLRRIPDAAP